MSEVAATIPRVTAELSNGISDILAFLAEKAKGYNNHLKWNEVDRLKADLMNARQRWIGVPLDKIRAEMTALGMRMEDVDKCVDVISKAQAGRRLVPSSRFYRGHKFPYSIDTPPPSRPDAGLGTPVPDWW